MNEQHFASGGCVCGAVSYTVKNPPARMAQCCCRDCQQSSGTGHMSLAFFNEDDVEIRGEASGYATTAESGNINTRYFCPTCGSRVFSRNSGRPGVIAITAGSVGNSDWFKPAALVYARSRPQWDLIDPDIPSFETMPPPPK